MSSISAASCHSAATEKVKVSRPGRRLVLPVAAGALGAALLTALYLGIVTLAQGWQHALDLLAEDRLLVAPIVAGFGIQVGLYTFLRASLHARAHSAGALAGAGGGTSTAAMVACCAHHLTDVLPLVGLSAATTFLATYKIPFMALGIGMNLLGIGVAIRSIRQCSLVTSTLKGDPDET